MKKRFLLFSSWLSYGMFFVAAVLGPFFHAESVPIHTREQMYMRVPDAQLPHHASGSGKRAQFAANVESQQSEKLTNEDCMDCHNPDILKLSKEELADQVVVEKNPVPPIQKSRYTFGELSLAIKKKEYAEGVHTGMPCVLCHKDVTGLPHPYPLKNADCRACHEKAGDSGLKASAHKAVPCIGCHDVHYGKAMMTYAKEFQRKVCLDCHAKYGMDDVAAHQNLGEDVYVHFESMDCMNCHKGNQPGVHNIPLAKKTRAGENEGMEQEGPPWGSGEGPPWRVGPHR